MKNNYKKNGNMRVRFETPEERTEIIRILEEQRGFRIDEKLKRMSDIPSWDNRTFDLNLKWKSCTYCVQPFIGAAMMSSGVRFYSAQEFFRIAELGFRNVPRFPVFHVPHNGRKFPEELMESVCVPGDVFLRYHEKMRDTDMILAVPEAYRGGHMCCSFQVSRLLCDVERFIGPEEIMEQYGMGFCYEKAYDGTVIKRVTEAAREKALRYYREHHETMDYYCGHHPRIQLFDLHSYSDEIVPEDFLRKGERTPDHLWEILYKVANDLVDLFREKGGNLTEEDVTRVAGCEMSFREGAMTRKDNDVMKLRDDEFEGKAISVEPHLKLKSVKGEPAHQRLHFCYDPELKKIIIGYLGDHLDSAATRYAGQR